MGLILFFNPEAKMIRSEFLGRSCPIRELREDKNRDVAELFLDEP